MSMRFLLLGCLECRYGAFSVKGNPFRHFFEVMGDTEQQEFSGYFGFSPQEEIPVFPILFQMPKNRFDQLLT